MPTPRLSVSYPPALLQLMQRVAETGNTAILPFPTKAHAWAFRRQAYGLRRALEREKSPLLRLVGATRITHFPDSELMPSGPCRIEISPTRDFLNVVLNEALSKGIKSLADAENKIGEATAKRIINQRSADKINPYFSVAGTLEVPPYTEGLPNVEDDAKTE
jgi:hypothetical protein